MDSNFVKRELKKAILHRKNIRFYKTENGAEVSDLFTSLIYTWEFNDANPLIARTELQGDAGELAKNPAARMPWKYHPIPPPTTAKQDPA